MNEQFIPVRLQLIPTSPVPWITTRFSPYAGFEAVVRYRVRAYLGVPLRDRRGRPLGAVAAVDTHPRQWTGEDLTALFDDGSALGRSSAIYLVDAGGALLATVQLFDNDCDILQILSLAGDNEAIGAIVRRNGNAGTPALANGK